MTELLSPAEPKAGSLASLGLMLIDRAVAIADSTRIATRTYTFGPLSVALQVAGKAYSQRLTPAIDFAATDDAQSHHFRIIALDSRDPAVGGLPHEQFLQAHSRQLEQQFECRERQVLVRYDANGETWRVASLAHRTAVSWTADARGLPDWENAAPLRDILHWACIPTACFLAHGSAIGVGEHGVLFTGPSGSGKSTTTAAAVLFGLQTLGDDFVLVDPTEHEMHALYNAVKLDSDGVRQLSDLRIEPDNPSWPAADKTRFRASELRAGAFVPRMRLKAIVVPRFAHTDKSTILAATQSEVMRALAPSTVLLLRGGQIETAAKAAALIRSLPAFRLELGRDPDEVAQTLGELISKRLQ
jgi:hypothetical protein